MIDASSMHQELEVRPFREEDEAALIRLWEVCFPDDPPRSAPALIIARKRETQPDLLLVGLWSGQVVASVCGGYDGHRGWAYHVATDPEYRRRGFGRRMMAALEASLSARGCPKLNLQVRTSNQVVVAFYMSLGYAIEERISLGKLLDGG